MDKLLRPSNIMPSDARAFFTTKYFPLDRDNMHDALAIEFNLSPDSIYLPDQKHTDRIHVLENGFETVVADAVVTKKKNVLIGVVVADCVPILLYDRGRKAIGAVHAGWRGTAGQIIKKTIGTMRSSFGSSPLDIFVAIGPCIRGCSYEVDEEVKISVERATGRGDYCRRRDKKYFIDLSNANKIQTLTAGVPEENIWQSEECTFCGPQRFFSYRFSGGGAGRQGGFIGMW